MSWDGLDRMLAAAAAIAAAGILALLSILMATDATRAAVPLDTAQAAARGSVTIEHPFPVLIRQGSV